MKFAHLEPSLESRSHFHFLIGFDFAAPTSQIVPTETFVDFAAVAVARSGDRLTWWCDLWQ